MTERGTVTLGRVHTFFAVERSFSQHDAKVARMAKKAIRFDYKVTLKHLFAKKEI